MIDAILEYVKGLLESDNEQEKKEFDCMNMLYCLI